MFNRKNKGKQHLLPKKKPPKPFAAEVRGKLCFAFDFGEYAAKIAVGKIAGGKIEVRDLLVVENDERSAKPDETNLKEWRGRLSRALSQRNLSAPGQIGLCTVGSRHYISRRLEIPYAEEQDRQGLVAYEMSQSLSLDPDAYLFQHRVVRTYDKNGVKMCSVWAAALPGDLCDNYYKLLESLKLRPLVMDISVNGMERLLTADRGLRAQTENRTIALVDFGIRGTEVGIYENGRYQESFRVDLGEGRLVAAAKNTLGVQIADIHNGNKLIVPPQAVYDIMRAAQLSEPAKAFRSAVEEWLTEINTVVKRYNLDHAARPVSALLLHGGSPQLSWLKAYLEKNLGIPAAVISSLDCCALSDRVQRSGNTVPQFLNALGLFLIQ